MEAAEQNEINDNISVSYLRFCVVPYTVLLDFGHTLLQLVKDTSVCLFISTGCFYKMHTNEHKIIN